MLESSVAESVLAEAASGNAPAQHAFLDHFMQAAQQEGGGIIEWLKAECWARMRAACGDPEGVRKLHDVLLAVALFYPADSEGRINRQAEAVLLLDRLTDQGHEPSAAALESTIGYVSPAAAARASRWSLGPKADRGSKCNDVAIERTQETICVAMLLARNGDPELQTGFDPAAWVADHGNVALVHGSNLALFTGVAPGVFEAHWLFAARGRQALDIARAALRSMFSEHGAQVIRGLTPIECTAAAWFNRQLGGKSLGIIATVHGAAELFVLAPGIIEGDTKWAS